MKTLDIDTNFIEFAHSITSVDALATVTCLTEQQKQLLLSNVDLSKYYKTFPIPKKDGTTRTITTADKQLQQIQRRVLDLILYRIPLSPAAKGFRPRASIVKAATAHVNKRVVLKIDLRKHFDLISVGRVLGLYLGLGFNEKIANVLLKLTVPGFCLPTGLSTSPCIANVIMRSLDFQLTKFCKEQFISYSRYADDLVFSSNKVITKDIIKQISKKIYRNGFVINRQKVSVTSRNSRQKVVGIVVNQKLNIERRVLHFFRSLLHHLEHDGIEATLQFYNKKFATKYTQGEFKKHLLGKFAHIDNVRPDLRAQFLDKGAALLMN